MSNIDRIIAPIEQELRGPNVIYLPGDQVRALEDQVWEELEESVAGGWRTQEEAQEAFLAWREVHREIGKAVLRGRVKPVY